MVAGERLETLLALMGLHLGSSSNPFSSKLHCCLGHQILNKKTSYNLLAKGRNLVVSDDLSISYNLTVTGP